MVEEKVLFQSKRLYVRTWKSSDEEALYQVMSRPEVHTYTGEQPWSRDETRSMIEWSRNHRLGWEPGFFNCPLILRATEQLIGRVGLNPFLKEENIPEIEWTISPEYWGKGYAKEIGRSMLTYGFGEAGFTTILGFALPQHQASRRLMEKIGMTYTGDREHLGRLWSFYQIEKQEFAGGQVGSK